MLNRSTYYRKPIFEARKDTGLSKDLSKSMVVAKRKSYEESSTEKKVTILRGSQISAPGRKDNSIYLKKTPKSSLREKNRERT